MGREGFRAYWLRLGLSVFGLAAISLPVFYLRSVSAAKSGLNIAVAAAWVIPAVLAASVLLIWASGLGVWRQARRLSRASPGSVSLYSQKSPELDKALAPISLAGGRSGFYYLLLASPTNLELYVGGQLLISVPASEAKEVRASTTLVRGLELPCVKVTVDGDEGIVVLALQVARSPWAALFPTSPSGALRLSGELSRHLGVTTAD